MPPASHTPVLDLQTLGPAARADPPAPPQPDRHDHSLAAERHVLHRRSRKHEHPVECGADPHVALLVVADLQTASRLPQKRRRRVAAMRANREKYLHDPESSPQQAVPRNRDAPVTPNSTGEPHNRRGRLILWATRFPALRPSGWQFHAVRGPSSRESGPAAPSTVRRAVLPGRRTQPAGTAFERRNYPPATTTTSRQPERRRA